MFFGFAPYASAPYADTGSSVVNVQVNVTGVQAVGYLGTAGVNGDANTNLTGVQGVGQVGTVSNKKVPMF